MLKIIYTVIGGCFFVNIALCQSSIAQKEYTASTKRYMPDFVFTHLTEKDGLSFNFVTDIIQDNKGAMWISTNFGLNRYDGQRFDVFKRNKKDKTTIIQNAIFSICRDSSDNIWGTTEDGIFCYDQKKKKFTNYYATDSIKYPQTHSIISDEKGQIWAGSNYGLVKIDKKKIIYNYIANAKDESFSISSNYISKDGIIADPKGEGLWISTNEGLNFYNFKTSKFTNYKNSRDSLIFNNHNIGPIHISKFGIIWMFDDQTNEILGFRNVKEGLLYKISVNEQIKDAFGGTLFETSYHHLWYSSNSYETVIIDYLNGNKAQVIKNDISDPRSIIGDYVHCAWEDKDNTVWLGTTGGISTFNHDRLFYKTIKLSDQYPELNNNWQITCLAQNPVNDDWWVATRFGKVFIISPKNGKTEVIDFTSFVNHDNSHNFITDVDFINGIAVICYVNGMTSQYDLKTKEYRKFYGLKGNYSDYKTRTISQESDSTYILGNNNFPVLRWNSNSNKIEEINFRIQKTKEGNNYTAGWLKSSVRKGTWMAASNTTLGYIHPGSTNIELVELRLGMNLLKGGFFSSMEVDKEGNAWFSFYTQGLFQARKKIDHVKSSKDIELVSWDASDGMIHENIVSAVPDKNGLIWTGAYNKYSVFDPANKSFRNFKINLSENNSFYYNYTIPLSNGNILTNIKGNLVEFFPDKMGTIYPKNEPLISILQVPGRDIYLSGESTITLEPEENFIKIGFGCLSDMGLYSYHFEYQLEGVNKDMVIADQNSEATYSDLAPGKYIFRLVARSSDKKWKSEEKTLTIIIKAPLYRTWWFISMMVILLGYILFHTLRARILNIRNINELKSKAQLLEKEKTAVMYENLKQHLNPHFLFNSLTSLSSLIRIDQRQAGDFLDKMSKIYRYILKNKDNETVPLIEELKFVDLYNQLQKTRFGNGLNITVNISEEYHYRKITPVTLQNLVENAIKHNIADEETPLSITMYIDDDYLVVQNNLQNKGFVETSNKQGQHSMISLYKYLSPRPVVIEESADFYTVKIPLI